MSDAVNPKGDMSAFIEKAANDIQGFKNKTIAQALQKRTGKTDWKPSIVKKFLKIEVDAKLETYFWQGKKLVSFAKQPRFETHEGKMAIVVDTTFYD